MSFLGKYARRISEINFYYFYPSKMNSQYNYSNFKTLDDERKERLAGIKYGEDTQNLYDSMINMIVNHKMELQKIPQCSSLAGAQAWATKRKLRAGQEDFDKDGVPEIVVYNKAGQPMIINGYRPKPSDYAIRNAYWSENPTLEKRIDAGPMMDWVKAKAYTVTEDPDNPWKRTIRKTQWGSELKEKGYKMPTKPKKQYSVFNIFCKLIAPYVNTYFDDKQYFQESLGETAGPSCVKLIKKIVSPISIYRALYLKLVERVYFVHLVDNGIITKDYKKFKEYLKNNPNKFWTYFKNNYLDRSDLRKFKETIINDAVVVRSMAKGELNWNMSDIDDTILVLMGADNIQTDGFKELVTIEEHADAMLEGLKSDDIKEKRKSRKELEKYKENSRKGCKVFFDRLQADFFTTDTAFQNYRASIEHGANITAQTEDSAVPSSPPRSVETGTAREERQPTTLQTTGTEEGDEEGEAENILE